MRRMSATLMALFAGSAAILAIAGIYGVVVRAVAERRREFGVRLALGATRDRVLASVLWWGLGLAATGLAVGLVGSWLSTRLLRGLLFGVGAADPVAYAGAIGMILVASLVACFRPAWQASRVDPAVTLRD
jgi:ABC-type antimicrobial peptide transport system permease subunit